jgi:UDP-N-acetylglucosamine 1-carboxyvinyltransferase
MHESFIIRGGKKLKGEITLSGAKNAALKLLITSILTPDELIFHNIPDIVDVRKLLDILRLLGVQSEMHKHTVSIQSKHLKDTSLPLSAGWQVRTSFMTLGPMLARYKEATIPNPGGCRLGARSIDWYIDALTKMGAEITYKSDDGFFHAKTKGLIGTTIQFEKNSHTGTEAVILAGVCAKGTTIIKNAAEEIEIDDLIDCLNAMGGKIKRSGKREIFIEGTKELHGIRHTVMPDRIEEATFAIAAAVTHGSVTIENSKRNTMDSFLTMFMKAGGTVVEKDQTTTTYLGSTKFYPTHITTAPHPGFMTDWQAPWALLMTQAEGSSTIHETIFENRFAYVNELNKMGADITFYEPQVQYPESFYNFRWTDRKDGSCQAIRIIGPKKLHNAILEMHDIRAGATLVLAALTAPGESILTGVDQIDRGYEAIDTRLRSLGADMNRRKENLP